MSTLIRLEHTDLTAAQLDITARGTSALGEIKINAHTVCVGLATNEMYTRYAHIRT